jgi:hypothetical protein
MSTVSSSIDAPIAPYDDRADSGRAHRINGFNGADAADTIRPAPAEEMPARRLMLRDMAGEREFASIYERIVEKCAQDGDRVDPALCRLLGLLPDLHRAADPWLVRQATITATYLARKDAEPRAARRLVDDLAIRVSAYKQVPAVHVMAGLGCFLVLLTLATLGLGTLWQSYPWDPKAVPSDFFIFNVSPWLVLAVAAAGGLGSMISMFSRLESYASLAGTDVRVLWLLGAVKPLMGVAFALFVFAVLQSNVLPFAFDGTAQANFTFLAVAFLAGFSERLSRVVAARLEDRIAGPEITQVKSAPRTVSPDADRMCGDNSRSTH